MKKRSDETNHEVDEIYNISNMLKSEGKTDGERRQFELLMKYLLFLEISLGKIITALFILIGLVLGKILSGLL